MNEAPETENQVANVASGPHKSRTRKTAIAAAVAVVAVAAIALLLWLLIPRGSGGRPVPAPRNMGTDQTSNQGSNATSTESTVRLAPEQAQRAGIEIEVPNVAVQVGNGMLMDLGRGDDKDWIGKPHDSQIEKGKEIKEQGMGDEPFLEHREADMQAICRPRMINMFGRLDLEAKAEAEITPPVDVRVAPVVVGRRPGGF